MFLRLSIVLLVLCVANWGHAQNVLREQLQKKTKKWGVNVSLLTQSTLQKTDSVNQQAYGTITVAPNYKLTNDLKLTASVSGEQQLVRATKSTLSNMTVTLQHSPFRVNKDVMWFPTLRSVVPTDVEDRKKNSFNGAAGAQATGIIVQRILGQNISIIPIVRVTKNYHEFSRNAGNTANISHSALGVLYFETSLVDKLTFGFESTYQHAWTYQSATRELFSFSQELSYEVRSNFVVTLGHTNSADVFASNGHSNNVSFFDENTSSVYLNLRGIY